MSLLQFLSALCLPERGRSFPGDRMFLLEASGTFSGEAHWHPTELPSLKYLQFLTFSVSRGHISAPSVLSPTHHEMGRNRAGAMAQRLRAIKALLRPLLQRIQFPACTWRLETMCDSSSRGSNTLVCRNRIHRWANTHTQKREGKH